MARVLLLSFFLSTITAAPVPDSKVGSYLAEWGFIQDSGNDAQSSLSISSAIRDFQQTYGLSVTGTINEATRRLMESPRCGMKDKGDDNARGKRQLRSAWNRGTITYAIESYPPGLTREFVRSEMNRAFSGWQQFAPGRKFEEARDSKNADIVLNFYTNEQHNRVCSARWTESVLAHAFFPENGQIHFNLEHTWTEPDKIGSIFFHEIGHALGLDHLNQDELNLMFPYYVEGPKHYSSHSMNDMLSSYS